jgi:predicted MFS family arabinose efflux permease
MFTQLITGYRNAFAGLPKEIWMLSFAVFVNRSGSMVLAFLTLYFTNVLGFSFSEAGFFLSAYGIGAFLGTLSGGKLSDKFNALDIQKLSLLVTGLMFFLLDRITNKESLFVFMIFISFFAEFFRPANAVSIVHFSSEKMRTRAFALNRLAVNIGMSVGPAIGGFLATQNYSYLFYVDGITSILAAILLFFFFKGVSVLPESQKPSEEIIIKPSNDLFFHIFLFFVLISFIAFFQVFVTLTLYLQQEFSYSEYFIGVMFTVNGITIALFEMLLVKRFEKKTSLKMISLGAILIGFGFLLHLFAFPFYMLIFAVFTWTIGEILVIPFINSFTSKRAKPQNRGTYMGMLGATFSIAHIFAPILGSEILQKYGGTALWVFFASLAFMASVGFFLLRKYMKST